MQEIETICPYTGLRPFTEEESLYFKGRDEQILKVTDQLEQRKFMMVTGASGDGKSSLIYAGLIPQVRAGFFKARYSNWVVADFRPERSPLKNMASALTRELKLEDTSTAEVELSRGFSSLVELYKSSSRFIDDKSSVWQSLPEEERNVAERQSANLLIIIDQFEEFFTNPENFPGGVPSQESRLLLNIILETIKISLRDDLPIYVVCTMRSDYIGQCAAFRGLPEFIGFSQFFVPRLQRKELRQVIEEPAILSGNRITNRLIDRLIIDLEEGTDQLPILQHALKQIWKAANHGQTEMDLIHYAMVGGMPGNQLPKEDKPAFETWEQTLPGNQKKYLESPGLANILDIHADKLYEEAATYCNQNGYPEITSKQAQFIIAMSFACLTRIDESRAVRNRMTLQEITWIINVPQFTTDLVGTVLSIFRESEHTLLRPFISENEDKKNLEPNTIIDITHEALIRNWKRLKKWADQEYDYLVTFQDFEKQVNRWIENGKSSDFLLPIGPLTFFENWYMNCRPNQYWINRYNNSEDAAEVRLKQSAQVLQNCKEFLRKSALQLLVTRTFMKFGAARIGMAAGMLLLVGLGIYFLYQWRVTSNGYVLDQTLAKSENIITVRDMDVFQQSFMLASVEQLKPGVLKRLTISLPRQAAIDLALNSPFTFIMVDVQVNPPILRQSMALADSLIHLEGPEMDSTSGSAISRHLNNLNDLVRNRSIFNRLKPDEELENNLNANVKSQAGIIQHLNSGDVVTSFDKKAHHIAITDILNFKSFSQGQIVSLISELSPFENSAARERFTTWFPANENIPVTFGTNFSHNGGYQTLAYLYAATGNVPRVLQCMDSLNKYNQNYDRLPNNSTHVALYLLMYNHAEEFKEFVVTYAKGLGLEANAYVEEMLAKIGIMNNYLIVKFLKHGNFNINFILADEITRELLFSAAYEISRQELKSPDALNFKLARLSKLEGVLLAKKDAERGIFGNDKPEVLFNSALDYYNNVSDSYLNEKIEVNIHTGNFNIEKRLLTRKHLFIYPDFFKISQPSIDYTPFRFYGDRFFHFMKTNGLFGAWYKTREDYQLLTTWVNSYFSNYMQSGNRTLLYYPSLNQSTFLSLDSIMIQSGYDLDNAWVKLKLIHDYFNENDTANAYRQVALLKFNEFERANFFEDGQPFHNAKLVVAGELAVRGKHQESIKLARLFANRKNRITVYAKLASLCRRKGMEEDAKIYLDSANAELSRLKDYRISGEDFRVQIVEALALQNNKEGLRKGLEYIGSMERFNRTLALATMMRSYCRLGEYHQAISLVPDFASSNDKAYFYNAILLEENFKKGFDTEWGEFFSKLEHFFFYPVFQNDLEVN